MNLKDKKLDEYIFFLFQKILNEDFSSHPTPKFWCIHS